MNQDVASSSLLADTFDSTAVACMVAPECQFRLEDPIRSSNFRTKFELPKTFCAKYRLLGNSCGSLALPKKSSESQERPPRPADQNFELDAK